MKKILLFLSMIACSTLRGIDANEEFWTALMADEDLKTIENYLKKDPNLSNQKNDVGQTALEIAIFNKSPFGMFIRNPNKLPIEDLTEKERNALDPENALKIIKILLKYGADANQLIINGQTPLFNSMLNKMPDVFELLLKYGANPFIAMKGITRSDESGKTISWNDTILNYIEDKSQTNEELLPYLDIIKKYWNLETKEKIR